MHVYLATKQYITELKEERKEFKSPKCKVILTRVYTNLKNQLQRQCPIDENECLFKTSNLTVETKDTSFEEIVLFQIPSNVYLSIMHLHSWMP